MAYRTPSANRWTVRGPNAPQYIRNQEDQNQSRTFYNSSNGRCDYVKLIMGTYPLHDRNTSQYGQGIMRTAQVTPPWEKQETINTQSN